MEIKRLKLLFSIIGLTFIIWSIIYIFNQSVLAIDNKRYFSLFDDAMISMRYAWNLSHGNGLVWNPGEYIEGYTNLLMTLLMSLITYLFNKSNAVLAVQIFGVMTLLSIGTISVYIANKLSETFEESQRKLLGIIIFICLLSYYPLIYWTLNGMETGVLTLFYVSTISLAFYYEKSTNRLILTLISIIIGLSYLTRPDSLIISCIIIIYLYIYKLKFQLSKDKWISSTLLLSPMVLIIFIQSLFRWVYYHSIYPNTYILKLVGIPLGFRIQNGIHFMIPFILTHILIIVPVIHFYIRFRDRRYGLFLAMILASIGYQIWVGGDPWPYWRQLAPIIPFLLISFVISLFTPRNIVSKFTVNNRPVIQHTNLSLGLFILVGILLANGPFLREELFLQKSYLTEFYVLKINTSIALNQLLDQNATIGVFSAGTIPYYTDRKSVDFLGKSDSYIANLPPDLSLKVSFTSLISPPGHNKYDLEYSIKKLKPTYVQYFHWGKQDLTDWGQANYVAVNYDGVMVYLLKGSPDVYWNRVKDK